MVGPYGVQATLIRNCVAEFLGTVFLLAAILAASAAGLPAFAAAGLTLAVLAATLGKVSGAHLNPAVTAGLVTAGKFSMANAIPYIVSQVLGAIVAVLLVAAIGLLPGDAQYNNAAFLAEFIGAFLLVFVVVRMVASGANDTITPLAIGGALGVGMLLATATSSGVLNPAIGFALLVTGNVRGTLGGLIPYLVIPILAGVAAGFVAKFLTPEA